MSEDIVNIVIPNTQQIPKINSPVKFMKKENKIKETPSKIIETRTNFFLPILSVRTPKGRE